MKKQLTVAIGLLITLGTTVAATLNEGAQPIKAVATLESPTDSMGAKQSAQIVALWKTHANSSGSVPLARPL